MAEKRATDLQFKKEFLRAFSLRCAVLLTPGIRESQNLRCVTQSCAGLQPKISMP
jgi:hypothetical protein